MHGVIYPIDIDNTSRGAAELAATCKHKKYSGLPLSYSFILIAFE